MSYPVVAAMLPVPVGALHAVAIPTEPAAIAVYVLLGWSVMLVWLASRRSKRPDDAEGETSIGGHEAQIRSDAGGHERSSGARSSSTSSRGKREKRKKKLSRKQRRKRGYINWIQ